MSNKQPSMPLPFGDGSKASLPIPVMTQLADTVTTFRSTGTPAMVQAVAFIAARICLPKEDVSKFVAYWNIAGRDIALGDYILQIAERAEAVSGNKEPPSAVESFVWLTEGHFHEVLHTAHIIDGMFQREIMEHPAVMQTPAFHEAAEAVGNAIHSFYQLAFGTHQEFKQGTIGVKQGLGS